MTSPKQETSTLVKPAPPAGEAPKVFRDQRFTSRVLILPDGRTLKVIQGGVKVRGTDATALTYLQAHRDFKAVEE